MKLEWMNRISKVVERFIGKNSIQADDDQIEIFINGTRIIINGKFIQLDSDKMMVDDVIAIRYGIFIESINYVTSENDYTLSFLDKKGRELTIECDRLFSFKAQREKKLALLVQYCQTLIIPVLLTRMIDRLDSGNFLSLGYLKLYKDHVLIPKKGYKMKWNQILAKSNNGSLVIKYTEKPKSTHVFEYRDTWNAVLFDLIRVHYTTNQNNQTHELV